MINILLFNILLYLSVKNLLINVFELQTNFIIYKNNYLQLKMDKDFGFQSYQYVNSNQEDIIFIYNNKYSQDIYAKFQEEIKFIEIIKTNNKIISSRNINSLIFLY